MDDDTLQHAHVATYLTIASEPKTLHEIVTNAPSISDRTEARDVVTHLIEAGFVEATGWKYRLNPDLYRTPPDTVMSLDE